MRIWGLPSPKVSWTSLGAAVKRDDPLPLLGTGETYPDCCVQLQAPKDKKKDGNLLEKVQHEVTEMMKHLQHEGRLRELGLIILE